MLVQELSPPQFLWAKTRLCFLSSGYTNLIRLVLVHRVNFAFAKSIFICHVLIRWICFSLNKQECTAINCRRYRGQYTHSCFLLQTSIEIVRCHDFFVLFLFLLFFLCRKLCPVSVSFYAKKLSLRVISLLLQLIRWLFRRVNASFPPTHSVLYLCQLWKMTGVLLTYFIRIHSQSISLSQNDAIKIQSVIISLIVGWKTNAGLDN